MQRRTYVTGLGSALLAGLAGCSAIGSSGDGDSNGDPDGDQGGNSSDDTDGNSNDGADGDSNDGSGEEGRESTELANGSFENGLDGWTVGKDLPPEPGEDSGTVDHGVEVVSETAADGESAVRFYISGVADDGTIWVEQTVDLADATAVEIDVYSRQQSFNEISQVAFFAGESPEGGLVEAEFDRQEQIEDHQGWKTYSYDVSDVSGTATVAVGMNVVWETEVRRLFDHVRLVTGEN